MTSPQPVTIYVALLYEAVDVWRPVDSEEIVPGRFRLGGSVPEGEIWQFRPGDVVECETRAFHDGVVGLVAIRLADE
jgi:hypothetical protein